MPTIKKIIDLSHALTAQTPVYPGDPVPEITVATTIANEGYNLFHVHLGSQTGSHVDAPYHFSNQGATVDRMDLIYFMGNGLIIDVSGNKSNEEITLAEIKKHEKKIERVKVVLFARIGTRKPALPRFSSILSLERGRRIPALKGIKTAGIDAINLDHTGGTEFPIHDMYAAAGGIIAENLANLDKVDLTDPFLIFLPLKLIGATVRR